MSLPRAKRGQAITSDLFNSVIDEINKNSVVSIVGGKLNRSINGTTLAIQPSPYQPVQLLPFTFTTTEESGIVYGNLSYGTMNNVLPENIYDRIAIGSSPISAASRSFVVLNCQTNGSIIQTVTWGITSVTPSTPESELFSAPANFTTLIHVLNGITPIRTIGAGSMSARVCETTRIYKSTFGANELAFDIYYTWIQFNMSESITFVNP